MDSPVTDRLPPSGPASPSVIFDLDGTLLDTLPDLHASMARTLARFGLPGHTPDEVRAMVGSGIARLVRDALPEDRRDEGFVREVRAAFKSDYSAHQLDLTRPYAGVPELLDALRSMGWAMAVLSNKDHENTVAICGHFFPGAFAAVLGASPSRRPKPDTGGAAELLGLLRRPAGGVFYLGDGENDMLVAKALGLHAVGAGWGFRSPAALVGAGADAVLDAPLDFLKIWRDLRGPDASQA
ncbi:MAG: HAD family hydrolase [Deltaproteobacteria bacterium]|nr:HAD family hydrolase [Deltaproteobacteria bacterium]